MYEFLPNLSSEKRRPDGPQVQTASARRESRSLGDATRFFPADDGHLVYPGQPCELRLVQAALLPETLDPLAEGACGEPGKGQEQFD